MSEVTLDASVALAWCFPDEREGEAEQILLALAGHRILVPAIWGLELANALLVGQRQKRLGPQEIQNFAALLAELPLILDNRPVLHQLTHVLPVAREHNLSAYDAAYLELALRRGTALATFDSKLRKAAKATGVELFGSGER